MTTLNRIRPDLLLLLSLLLMILLHPILDRSTLRRLLMEVLIFLPVVLATIRLAEIKRRLWPTVLLMAGAMTLAVVQDFWQSTEAHLYTAVSIYLLLGLLWFSLYCAVDTYYPGSISQGGSVLTHREDQLLYFSLITLSTIGYGDIVPVDPEVRMLAALEGLIGVLYIAITVAILVSAFRHQHDVPDSPRSF